MLLDGAVGHDDAFGDAGVRQALGHQREHLALARREIDAGPHDETIGAAVGGHTQSGTTREVADPRQQRSGAQTSRDLVGAAKGSFGIRTRVTSRQPRLALAPASDRCVKDVLLRRELIRRLGPAFRVHFAERAAMLRAHPELVHDRVSLGLPDRRAERGQVGDEAPHEAFCLRLELAECRRIVASPGGGRQVSHRPHPADQQPAPLGRARRLTLRLDRRDPGPRMSQGRIRLAGHERDVRQLLLRARPAGNSLA